MDSAGKESVECGWLRGEAKTLKPVVFAAKDGQYILRRMTVADYSAVRELLPLVSRGHLKLATEDLEAILKQPTYIPFCCFSVKPDPDDNNHPKEGELCGFCEVYVMPHLSRAADGRLERVVVSPSFRGKGIATSMCRLVLQLAKEQLQLGRLDLTVEKPEAKHIYTKLGFVPVPTEILRLQN